MRQGDGRLHQQATAAPERDDERRDRGVFEVDVECSVRPSANATSGEELCRDRISPFGDRNEPSSLFNEKIATDSR